MTDCTVTRTEEPSVGLSTLFPEKQLGTDAGHVYRLATHNCQVTFRRKLVLKSHKFVFLVEVGFGIHFKNKRLTDRFHCPSIYRTDA